jgi:SNF2 family DNA or RNA helicase
MYTNLTMHSIHVMAFCFLFVRRPQSEVILRCGLSPYQSALYDIVKAALRAERDKAKVDKGPGALTAAKGVKGINNTVMELRCICNHPMLR